MDVIKIEDILRKADSIIFDESLRNSISVKGSADYVTKVDIMVQEYLQSTLQELYPEIAFMGEEKNNQNVDFTLDTWIIDPIDGTTNLIHDCQFSAISVGLWSGKEQKIVFGMIYQPFSKDIYYAEAGQGAYLNGNRIHVSKETMFANSLIAIGTSPYQKELADDVWAIAKDIFLHCADIRRAGAASLDLAYVACGKLDGFYEQTLSAWDYAAGMLILKEAGGVITDYLGNEPAGNTKSSICCCNPNLQKEMLNIIQRNIKK